MNRKLVCAAVCAIFIPITVSVTLAQLPTGTILGEVKDSSSAVIAGANVTARDSETGQSRSAVTQEDGSYRMDNLPVGDYQLSVEKSGFKTEVQTGLNLAVAQQAVANFTLQVGETSQRVEVTGEAPLVTTTTSSLGGLVDEQRMADLPLNGRNYVDLTLLQTGVTKASYFAPTQLGSAGTVYSSNGAPVRSNNYMLDGALLQTLQAINGASVVGNSLGVDGIREYRVITNNFSAEYGMTMGSQMVIVSKSGTNQFHGDAFEFLRNSDLDARNYFDLPPARLGHRLPEFRRNNFGGAFGGPIRRDKTFFFGVYEGLSQAQGTTNTANVLAAGCHGPAGASIWNGVGAQPAGSIGPCVALGGTTSTTATIAPQMAPLVALYPLPNIGTSQFGYAYTAPTTEHYGQIRIDQTISATDTLFGRYTVDQSDQTTPFNPLPPWGQLLTSRTQFLTLSESHIISASLLNTARFSFSRTNLYQNTVGFVGANEPAPSGPQYSFVPGQPMGLVSVSGLTNIGTASNTPKLQKQNIFTYSDDLVYTHGRHTFKFGAAVNHYQMYMEAHGVDKGNPSFGSIASFFTAQMSTYQEVLPGAITARTYHFDAMGFYGQDDWRVTPRLTLNLGMRYEPTTTYEEQHGISASLRNFLTDTSTTLGPPFRNPSLRNWSPRFGFAWDVNGNGHTAVRGGFSLLYDVATFGSSVAFMALYTPPFDYTIALSPGGTLTIPYVVPANIGPSAFRGTPYYMDQPHMMQYNLTVERQLPFSMALTVAYVGSRGINLLQYEEGNPTLPNGVPVGAGTPNETCAAPPAGTTVSLANQVDGVAVSCWLPNAVRRNPNFPSMVIDPAGADSIYNGLEVVLNKRLSKGLQFQSSYTWSKLIGDVQGESGGDNGGGVGTTSGQDVLNQRTDRGPVEFDVTNVWHFNAIYHLPDFASSGYKEKLFNGWWTSGILTLESGYPFYTNMTADRSLAGVTAGTSGIDRPDVLPGRMNSNITHGVSSGCGTGATRAAGGTAVAAGTQLGTPTLYFDPCAYSVQPQGFLGNEGRNSLRGPGLSNLDYSLVKDTSARFLGESGKIEFRAEAFNILNHPQFAVPGATVFGGTCPGTGAAALVACTPNPNASAGVITRTIAVAGSRQLQLGLKVIF